MSLRVRSHYRSSSLWKFIEVRVFKCRSCEFHGESWHGALEKMETCSVSVCFVHVIFTFQVLPSDPLGSFQWPFQGLSDLHLGNQKVTWKKLVYRFHSVTFQLRVTRDLKQLWLSRIQWGIHYSPNTPPIKLLNWRIVNQWIWVGKLTDFRYLLVNESKLLGWTCWW